MEKSKDYPSTKEGIYLHTAYELVALIGSGNFGSVYKSLIKSGVHAGSYVAIKIIDLEKYDNESIVDIKVHAFPERNIHYEPMRP